MSVPLFCSCIECGRLSTGRRSSLRTSWGGWGGEVAYQTFMNESVKEHSSPELQIFWSDIGLLLSLKAFGNFWLFLATFGSCWQLLAYFGNFWHLMAILQHWNIATLYKDQLDGPAWRTSWTDQMGGPDGRTAEWTSFFTWSLGQFVYLKIDLSVCTLSQLPSPTKALF